MDKSTTRSMVQKKENKVKNVNSTVKEVVLSTKGNVKWLKPDAVAVN